MRMGYKLRYYQTPLDCENDWDVVGWMNGRRELIQEFLRQNPHVYAEGCAKLTFQPDIVEVNISDFMEETDT